MAKVSKPEATATAATESVGVSESDQGGAIATDSELAKAAAEGAAAPQFVRVRVLAFCGLGKPDDVIEMDTEEAATLIGVVDADPAAVAYADSLQG